MRVYAIREFWAYEIDTLIEFFRNKSDAERRAVELNKTKSKWYDEYTVEEWEVK